MTPDMQARRTAARRVYKSIPEGLQALCVVLLALDASVQSRAVDDEGYADRMQALVDALQESTGVSIESINNAWAYCLAGFDASEAAG
jgi:hypothetical protein